MSEAGVRTRRVHGAGELFLRCLPRKRPSLTENSLDLFCLFSLAPTNDELTFQPSRQPPSSRNTQRFSLTSSSRSSSSTMKKTVVFRNSLDEVPEGARPAAAAAENVAPGDGIEELDNGDSIEVAPQHHAQLRRQRSTDESNSFSEEATFANSVL